MTVQESESAKLWTTCCLPATPWDTDFSLSSNDDVLSVAKVAVKELHVFAGKVLWAHMRLKTLHLAFEGHTRVFLCGRKIS